MVNIFVQCYFINRNQNDGSLMPISPENSTFILNLWYLILDYIQMLNVFSALNEIKKNSVKINFPNNAPN